MAYDTMRHKSLLPASDFSHLSLEPLRPWAMKDLSHCGAALDAALGLPVNGARPILILRLRIRLTVFSGGPRNRDPIVEAGVRPD